MSGWTQSKGDQHTFAKLTTVNEITIGGVGYADENALIQLFAQTHQPHDATDRGILEFLSEFQTWKAQKTNNYNLTNQFIIIFRNHAFATDGFLIREITQYDAIGAGMDFALAALHLNKSATTAVDVACELSAMCERPIKTLVIKTPR